MAKLVPSFVLAAICSSFLPSCSVLSKKQAPIQQAIGGRTAGFDGDNLKFHDTKRGLFIVFTGGLSPTFARQAIDEFMRTGNAGHALSRLNKATSPQELVIRFGGDGDDNIHNDPWAGYHMPNVAHAHLSRSLGTVSFADANGSPLPSRFDVPFPKALELITAYMGPYLNAAPGDTELAPAELPAPKRSSLLIPDYSLR